MGVQLPNRAPESTKPEQEREQWGSITIPATLLFFPLWQIQPLLTDCTPSSLTVCLSLGTVSQYRQCSAERSLRSLL